MTSKAPKNVVLITLIIGVWLCIGLFISVHSYFSWNREGLSVVWWQVASLEGTRWGLWIFITFFVLWMLRHFPIKKERWISRLALHFAVGATLCILHFAADTQMHLWVRPWPLPMSFAQLFVERLGSIRIYLTFVVYAAILGTAHAIDYYRMYHDGQVRALQLEKQLAEAQLQALKMQLHPHFLFNTLNAIASLTRNNKNQAATDMLAGLSDLLRLILQNAAAQEVSLKQELEFLRRYLEIEQIRFEDRLQIEIDVPPATLDAAVPNLVLQPLVENAIRHGVASNPNAGLIEIKSQKDNGKLKLTIRNTGPDAPPPDFKEHHGTGLSNTRARLARLYGPDQSLELTHEKDTGTRVTLTIPFRLSGGLSRSDAENQDIDRG